jgi:hypothetical protein
MQAVKIMLPARGYHIPPLERKETKLEREARQKREADIRWADLQKRLREADEEEARIKEAQRVAAEKAKAAAAKNWKKKATRRENKVRQKLQRLKG